MIGSLQASEALKLLLGAGDTLVGRLLLFDALGTTWDEVAIRRDPDCPVCGDTPTITSTSTTSSSARRRAEVSCRDRSSHSAHAPWARSAARASSRPRARPCASVLENLTGRYPSARASTVGRRRRRPVRERLRRRRGRARRSTGSTRPSTARTSSSCPRWRVDSQRTADSLLGLIGRDAARRAPAPRAERPRQAVRRSSRARTRPARSRTGSRSP